MFYHMHDQHVQLTTFVLKIKEYNIIIMTFTGTISKVASHVISPSRCIKQVCGYWKNHNNYSYSTSIIIMVLILSQCLDSKLRFLLIRWYQAVSNVGLCCCCLHKIHKSIVENANLSQYQVFSGLERKYYR